MPESTSRTADIPDFEPAPATLGALEQAVASGAIAICCDSPPLDACVRAAGYLDVVGWAYCRAGLDGVSVYLDGVAYPARLGIERTDLATRFGEDLRACGFALTVELDASLAGRRSVAVVARSLDGRATGVSGSVVCVPAASEIEVSALARDWPFELLAHAERQRAEAERRLEAITNSRSWRLTRPLRRFADLVRSRRVTDPPPPPA